MIKISDFDKVEYWIELAIYDLDTAKAMLKSKRYLYVGFMCNQVDEEDASGFLESISKYGEVVYSR